MTVRSAKKQRKIERKWAQRQYIKHRRHNMVYARPGVHDFILVLDNLKPNFNIGKIFRSGDAFGAHSIHLIGTEYFEVKPAKGSFKWIPATFHQTFAQCFLELNDLGYTFYILEPDGGKALPSAQFPKKSAFIFGHEEFGISFDRKNFPEIQSISVPQFGRVESLNVSVAASVVMYEYVRQQTSPQSV